MSFWTNRSVLVTGATGFLGTALCAALAAHGARVVRLLRASSTEGNTADIAAALRDAETLTQALRDRGIDTVFHLAAQAIADTPATEAATYDTNVAGTWSLLDACRRSGSVDRFVLASSAKVYGAQGDAAIREDAPLAGQGAYALSKIAGELFVRSFGEWYGLRGASARLGNLFGAGDRQTSRIVPATLLAAVRGERPLILSDGTAELDYLHVDDAVEALLRIAERVDHPEVAGQSFNIASGTARSVVDIARAVVAAAGRADIEPLVMGAPGPAVRQYLSVARAATVLDWIPAPFAERLAETVAAPNVELVVTQRPRVFIGIPTLNRPDMVRETLASVVAQSFGDYTVVVSDNCSAAGIAEEVGRFVAGFADQRFRFAAQPVNGGEYGQGRFLFAAAAATGADYFMILHDDDLLDPKYLATAVAALDAAPDAALFVANPELMDRHGTASPERTRTYLDEHGRNGRAAGRFDILDAHMASGFTPMSGTLFRTAAITRSGLTDDDCFGNYPFECNVILRLGDHGEVGWFCPEKLLRVRYHDESLRVYLKLMDNPEVVRTMLTLFERRRYTGAIEARRRVLVSRLRRADGLLRLRAGDMPGCRSQLRGACVANPRSGKAWMMRAMSAVAPGALRAILPSIGTRDAPVFGGAPGKTV